MLLLGLEPDLEVTRSRANSGTETAPAASKGVDRIGAYEILGPLGSGGMGNVYRARDTRLGRVVALKFVQPRLSLAPGLEARFEREARVLASLNHPNIAVLYGLEEGPDAKCLVLELVEGDTLASRLSVGRLSLEEALDIGAQVATGLAAAHAKGIVHRDLKPENVMLAPDGMVKLVDFGLAKAAEIGGVSTLTATGVVMGTVPYMSPEQVMGKDVDPRTDIWSFGCLLYEALTGSNPFPAGTAAETIAAILERTLALEDLPEGTPPSVHELIARCLVKDPERRLGDIAEAGRILEDALQSLQQVPPAARRYAFWIAAAVLAAFAGLFSVWSEPLRLLLRASGGRLPGLAWDSGSLTLLGLVTALGLAALWWLWSGRSRIRDLTKRLPSTGAWRWPAGVLVLALGTYGLAAWWSGRARERSNETVDVCVVLPFERLNDEEERELLDISEHFRATLAEVFGDVDSVRVLPEIFVPERMAAFPPQCSYRRTAEWVKDSGLIPDIVLCSTVDLFDDREPHSGVLLVSTLNWARDGILVPARGRIREAGAYADVQWLALHVSFRVLELLSGDPRFHLAPEDHDRAKRRILEGLSQFLAFREGHGADLNVRVEAALELPVISNEQVGDLLGAYASAVDMERYAQRHAIGRSAAMSRPIEEIGTP